MTLYRQMVMTGQPVFMLLLCDFPQVAEMSRPMWKRFFMWGAPWDGWRTATTEGGGHPLCGQEGELRTWVLQQGSQPLAGQPGSKRKERKLTWSFRSYKCTLVPPTGVCHQQGLNRFSFSSMFSALGSAWVALHDLQFKIILIYLVEALDHPV